MNEVVKNENNVVMYKFQKTENIFNDVQNEKKETQEETGGNING